MFIRTFYEAQMTTFALVLQITQISSFSLFPFVALPTVKANLKHSANALQIENVLLITQCNNAVWGKYFKYYSSSSWLSSIPWRARGN